MKGHAIRSRSLEESCKAPARMGWHLMSHTPLSQWLQDRNQGGRERARKGPRLSSLRLTEGDRISLEVDIFKRERGVSQSAARMHRDMKAELHPLRLDLKQLKASFKLRVGDLCLPARPVFCDAECTYGVRCNHAQSSRVNQHHLQDLHILQGSVLVANAMSGLSAHAPGDELLPVGKLHLRGVGKIIEGQPMDDMPPGAGIVFQSGGRLAMKSEPAINPPPSLLVLRLPSPEGLRKSRLGTQNFSSGRLHLALSTQARRCSHPFSIRQFPFQKPKWRVWAGVKRSHKASVTL